MRRVYTSLLVLTISFLLLNISVAEAQTITRGPYLQIPTPTGVTVCWRTDAASSSQVKLGTDPGNLDITVNGTATGTEHRVEVTGLQPNTKYYYSIGTQTGVLAGPSNGQNYTTAPTAGTAQPIRVWAIGDFGKGNAGQRDVRNSYLDYVGSNHTDVWLWLGDNAYDDGTDAEYQVKVFDSINAYYHQLKYLPFMPTPGNHDYNSVNRLDDPTLHTGPYYEIVETPANAESGGVASGTELYYSFDYGNVHFISLNSEIDAWTGALDLNGFNGSTMTDWLELDLQSTDKEWIIAFFHQPPFSKGSHDSDDFWEVFMRAMRKNIIPILEDYGVDLVISGHSHVYERSYLINGFYDDSGDFNPANDAVNYTSGNIDLGEHYIKLTDGSAAHKGTIYVVNGNAGSDEGNPDLDHGVMFFGDGGDDAYGSFIMEIDDNRLDGKYLSSDGNILDEFTIFKASIADTVGGFDTTGTTVGVASPTDFQVGKVQIYPNPFSMVTNIKYTVREQANITFEVVDMNGKLVKSIVEGPRTAGTYDLILDGNQMGLAQGNYIIKLIANENVRYEKLVKLR